MSDRLQQLTKMFEADSADPFLPYGIALEHAKQEDFEAALQWLDKTLQIDPQYCYAYYQKAKMFSELGDEDKAVAVLEEGMNVAVKAGDDHARSEMAELLAAVREA